MPCSATLANTLIWEDGDMHRNVSAQAGRIMLRAGCALGMLHSFYIYL